jgi:hypothetical protein
VHAPLVLRRRQLGFAKFVMFTNAAWAMVGGLFIIETLLLACNSFR